MVASPRVPKSWSKAKATRERADSLGFRNQGEGEKTYLRGRIGQQGEEPTAEELVQGRERNDRAVRRGLTPESELQNALFSHDRLEALVSTRKNTPETKEVPDARPQRKRKRGS